MWKERNSPKRIEKRFEFVGYQSISNFMEKIDYLCKEKSIFPNISFGKNFVSITIFIEEQKIHLDEKKFSIEIDKIFESVN